MGGPSPLIENEDETAVSADAAGGDGQETIQNLGQVEAMPRLVTSAQEHVQGITRNLMTAGLSAWVDDRVIDRHCTHSNPGASGFLWQSLLGHLRQRSQMSIAAFHYITTGVEKQRGDIKP